MKAKIGASALALALLLAACGGEDSQQANGGTASAAGAPQLKQVEAPNGDWTQVVEETPEGGFRMGNPNAPVKLVEYASLTCPHCKAFSDEGYGSLTGQYVKSGQVSYEFRNFVLNPVDLSATLLARCAGAQAFFPTAEQLFAQQQQWTNIPPAEQQRIQNLPREQQTIAYAQAGGLDQFFQQRGLPQQKVQSCLSDQQQIARLVEFNNKGMAEGVQGTPTFFINGDQVENVTTWQALEPELRKAVG